MSIEIYCPYCDSEKVVVKDVVSTKEVRNSYIVVRKAYCPECKEISYAVRVYSDPNDSTQIMRRDQLQAKTGIRIRRIMPKRA